MSKQYRIIYLIGTINILLLHSCDMPIVYHFLFFWISGINMLNINIYYSERRNRAQEIALKLMEMMGLSEEEDEVESDEN